MPILVIRPEGEIAHGIPEWMTDAAACASHDLGERRVCVGALMDLVALVESLRGDCSRSVLLDPNAEGSHEGEKSETKADGAVARGAKIGSAAGVAEGDAASAAGGAGRNADGIGDRAKSDQSEEVGE
jgi:hypothetical protein